MCKLLSYTLQIGFLSVAQICSNLVASVFQDDHILADTEEVLANDVHKLMASKRNDGLFNIVSDS